MEMGLFVLRNNVTSKSKVKKVHEKLIILNQFCINVFVWYYETLKMKLFIFVNGHETLEGSQHCVCVCKHTEELYWSISLPSKPKDLSSPILTL